MQRFLVTVLFLSITISIGFSQIIDKTVIQNRIADRHSIIEKRKEAYNQLRVLLPAQPAEYNNYDANYYHINLQIKPDQQMISGTTTVKVTAHVDGTNQIVLDLFDNMVVSAVTGNAVSFSHTNDQLTIQLDKIYNYGDLVEVSIAYSGQPTTRTNFEAFRFIRRGVSYHICTDNQPYYARTWFPCKDIPGDKPDSVDITITVPQDLFVVTNGVLLSIIDNNDSTKTYSWHGKSNHYQYCILRDHWKSIV